MGKDGVGWGRIGKDGVGGGWIWLKEGAMDGDERGGHGWGRMGLEERGLKDGGRGHE
jgi:hypothetical protein